MRLYNAESCTPVVTSTHPSPKKAKKWVPPKGLSPSKIPWGQDVLKKNRFNEPSGQSEESPRAVNVETPTASFQDAFDPFDFSDDVEDGNWESMETFKPHGSPDSNRIKLSSTSSTGELTPDAASEFHTDQSSNKLGIDSDAVGVKQFFQAKANQLRLEKKLLLSPGVASEGALSDNSSLTSTSTFCSTTSDSDQESTDFVHSPHPSLLKVLPSSCAANISPTGSPRSFKPAERDAMPGFPMFDIDSISDASDVMSYGCLDREAAKPMSSEDNMDASISSPLKPKAVPCKLDTRFRGLSDCSTASKKKTVVQSFVPKEQVAHDGDELLTVRARLKKVTTNRGGPFRAHSGVSPPPQKPRRSVVVMPDSFNPIGKYKCASQENGNQNREVQAQNSSASHEDNQVEEGGQEPLSQCQSEEGFEPSTRSGVHDFETDGQESTRAFARSEGEGPSKTDSSQPTAYQERSKADLQTTSSSREQGIPPQTDHVPARSNMDFARKNLSDMLQQRAQHSEENPPPRKEQARANLAKMLASRQKPSFTPDAFAPPPSELVAEADTENECSTNLASSLGSDDTRSPSKDGMQPDPVQTIGGAQETQTVPLKDDPKYAKFFTMLKRGVPMGAVQHAMMRDGFDPSILDGDHNSPAPSTENKKGNVVVASTPKDTHRRIRLHWKAHNNVKTGSVWALLESNPKLICDEVEFKELFQAELGSPVKSPPRVSQEDEVSVKVIDPKRANNGGIILATIKLAYSEIAEAVNAFDVTAFTPEQIRGIAQLLPTAEETKLLKRFLSQKPSMMGICECEKFMVTMMNVPHAKRKLDALLFMQKFSSAAGELRKDSHLVQRACDEIMSSVELRKVLGAILDVGNRLNAAGISTKKNASAITLDSLLMLHQTKAFDKKTTFLQYVARLLLKNDVITNRLKDELPSVFKAEKIHWDFSVAELGRLENELENLRRIALSHGQEVPDDDDTLSDKSLGLGLQEETQILESTSVGRFTLAACLEIVDIVGIVESCKQKHTSLLRYFGEEDKEDELRSHEVFQILATFSTSFEEAISTEKEKLKRKECAKTFGSPVLAPKTNSDMGASFSPSKSSLRGNMGAVLNEMAQKSKKKRRWGRRKR